MAATELSLLGGREGRAPRVAWGVWVRGLRLCTPVFDQTAAFPRSCWGPDVP